MSAQSYMKQSLNFIHGAYRQAADGLSGEQIHMVPEGESHSIAWIMWHGARVEDLIVQQMIKGQPQEWVAGGWADQLGLPAQSFGTGHTTDEARAIHIKDAAAFQRYADAVAAHTHHLLDTASDEELEREISVGQRKETVGQAITLHLVTHLNGHRGEINLLRGMMGFPPVANNQGG